jgi:hypothetical protein
MKSLKHISTLLVVFFLSLFLVNCEKVNPEMEIVADPGIEASQLKAAEIGSSAEIDYLMSLIADIESLVDGGVLNKGQANALIVKIENAIKSLEKGNSNAAENQLSALISQTEDFVDNGIFTKVQGQTLITVAENVIALLDGNEISLINTTWDFTVNYSETVLWHADVTFYPDGTTKYDEPDDPGIYVFYGTWSMEGNILFYIMDSSGGLGTNYQFTGTLSGITMNGTFTLGDGTGTWSATLK